MKSEDKLRQILEAKTESLKGLCDTLDGAGDWFEVFCKAGYSYGNQKEFMKTVVAFSDVYKKYFETLQAIKVLKYVLDEPVDE